MNLMWDYERAKNQNGWAWHYSVSAPRLRRLLATRNSLRSRVAEFTGVDVESLCIEKPPVQMEHAKVTLLRVIQVWVFSDTMIESIQAATATDGSVTLSLTGDRVTASHLEQVLDTERHPFAFVSNREIAQTGTFSPVSDDDFAMNTFLSEFESRYVSLAVEKSINVFWYSSEEAFHFLAPKCLVELDGFAAFCNTRLALFEQSGLTAQLTEQRRGVKERPCGRWDIRSEEDGDDTRDDITHITKWSCTKQKVAKTLSRYLNRHVLDLEGVTSSMNCTFTKFKKKKGRYIPSFSLISRGTCSEVFQTDLCDLFLTSNVTVKTKESASVQQKIVFSQVANAPIPYDKHRAKATTGDHGPDTSWHRPLLNDIPEGARILSVLASGRRKEHSIRFSAEDPEEKGEKKSKKDDETYLEVFMNKDETKISQRWRQFSSDRKVYVAENSVPATSMSMLGPIEVFACCANTLEVRGGGLRVEGLTLLPPGRLFTLLSFLTFGLQPFSTGQIFGDNLDDECDAETLLSQSLRWLNKWEDLIAGISDSAPKISPPIDRAQRILAAKAFHGSCAQLGEALVCQPDKVHDLCSIFDMIDGYEVRPWHDLEDNPFVEENLGRRKSKKIERAPRAVIDARASNSSAKKSEKKPSAQGEGAPTVPLETLAKGTPLKDALREAMIVDEFPEAIKEAAARLFAITLEPGVTIGELDLPSTNILCVVVQHYCDFLLENNLMPDEKDELALERHVSLTDRHWLIRAVRDNGGKEWYLAEFVGTAMPFLSVKKRGGKLPGWIVQGRPRPTTAKQAMSCVPPNFANVPRFTTKIAFSECESGKAVFFESVETALRLEAAFWLERQFGDWRRWYQQDLEEMLTKAISLETVVPRED